jgi:hypothetical protein
MGTVPETHKVPFINQPPLLSAPNVGYFRAFVSFLHEGISHSNYMPVAGGYGSILFGANLALIASTVITQTVMIALVIQQLDRPSLCAPGQYDRKASEAGGIGKPAESPEHRTLERHGNGDLRPFGQRWDRLLSCVGGVD